MTILNSIISTPQRFISVSRPRRFGKTMAADMICAYYDRSINSHVLFENKKLADTDNWEVYINAFNVIRVVMTDFVRVGGDIEQGLGRLKERILEELSEEYQNVKYDPDDFVYSMQKFYTVSKMASGICMILRRKGRI